MHNAPLAVSQRDNILSIVRVPTWCAAGVAAMLLALGFADLARGGITIAPVLLTLAYCVAIPWALLSETRRPSGREAEAAPPYLAATLASMMVLTLYVLTRSPSTAMWDTSEYIAAAYTMGLPHPPGNPMFVIVGRFFSLLPIAPTVAMRINLLAAISSAVAAGIWFLITERVARHWGLPRPLRYTGGALAALIGATAFTVWNQSVVNEKVYTVSLLGIAVVVWLALRWSDQPHGPRADRLLLLIAYLLGLGYANHMAGMLPLPAVGILILVTKPRTLLRWKLLLFAVVAVVLGMTPFATQPIRAAFNPAINEGEPTACRDGLRFSCTFSRGTYEAFRYNFDRKQYAKPDLAVRQAPAAAQLGMWWLYFKWQWLRDAHDDAPALQGALAATYFLLAVLGALIHRRHDRTGFALFAPLMGSMTLALIYYLNFRYGASQSPGLEVEREVRDRDYFYLWSYSAWGVWAALGLVGVWRALAGVRLIGARGRMWVLASPVLLLAVVPLIGNWRAASHRGDETTIAFARDLLNSVEPYSVLVTAGDNDTFPLWYAQEVEGVRKDVTVAVLSLMNTDWFARGIIRRPVYAYDAALGPAVYRGRTWPRPAHPPLRLTMDEADSVPPMTVVSQPLAFRARGLDVTIDPAGLAQVQGGGMLERADLLFLRMIADGWPERPIYISRTTGSYGQQLGLGPHLVSQGLARKLVLSPDSSDRNLVMVQGSGWFDLARSHALWEQFDGPAALVRRNDWVDRPSLSSVYAYVLGGVELAEVMQFRGDSAGASRVRGQVRAVARAARVPGEF